MSIGEALLTLRRAQGTTQAALADATLVTQAALSRYENDIRTPGVDALDTLAAALGVTAEFIQRAERMHGAFMVGAHMRRRRTAKATVWRRLEACLNVYRVQLDMLARHVEVAPTLSLPLFDPLEYSPDDAARMVRMQWRMPSGPVRDLLGWMEAAGCVVIAEDFGSLTGGGRVDGLSQWAADQPLMLVNSRAPTDRGRMTVAHELGHICLHSSELGGDPEDEANAFAAEFLMPADVIRSDLRNLTLGKLHDLKRHWGVSMQALIERAHQLDTVSSAQRTGFYKTLSKRGWRTKEPLSEDLAPERPRLAASLGQALLDGGLTHDEAVSVAGLAPGTSSSPFFPAVSRLSAV